MFYSYACALEGVPTVFLSGNKMLCDDFKDLHPKLVTCPVKDGFGALTLNYSTEDTVKSIRELSEKALSQDLGDALVELPSYYDVEFCFNEHKKAQKAAFFPGVKREDNCIVSFQSDNYYEVLRTLLWIV